MIHLLKAFFPTMMLIAYHLISMKRFKSVGLYLLVYLGIAGSSYLCDSYLHAVEISPIKCSLTQEQRDKCWDMIHRHYYEAYASMATAEFWSNRILYDYEQKITKASIAGVVAGILSRDIKSAGITAAASLLQETIEGFVVIWPKIEHCYNLSAYHVEMAEFFQDVLAADG